MKFNNTYKETKGVSGIYLISNDTLEKCYVGSAKDIYSRYMNHKKDLSKNIHTNSKLQNYYNKHGAESLTFEVIRYCKENEMIWQEQYFIDGLKPFFNIVPKAGNSLGYKHTETDKAKMSLLKKGKQTTGMLGKKHRPETLKKISDKAKTRKFNPNFKEDINDKINRQRKLDDKTIGLIKHLLRIGVRQKTIARDYAVSQRLVSRIKNNIGFYANV